MSEDFPSSNPFRRRAPTVSELPEETTTLTPYGLTQPPAPLDIPDHTKLEDSFKPQSKPVKKVRVLSPPPSSPEADSISYPSPFPIRDENDTPQNDPFDYTTSDTSDVSDNEGVRQSRQQAPVNPFQKTLATLEHTEGNLSNTTSQTGPGTGRASLDVESFKRLLMTGSAAGTGATAALQNTTRVGHTGITDGTSTEASSISKQSLFEPIQGNHPESPRTSHEVSDPDEEHRRVSTDNQTLTADRKKPPPPSSRHGKLIKVELKDEALTKSLDAPSIPASRTNLSTTTPNLPISSPTDLNKPLPPAPRRESHDSDRESVFDKEAAGKTPEPPSPSSSLRRKTPPAPPLSRRHSHLVSDTRGSKAATPRLSPQTEGNASSSSPSLEYPFSTPGVGTPPPPPPPRRPATGRNSSNQPSLQSGVVTPSDSERPTPGVETPFLPSSRIQPALDSSRPQSVVGVEASSKRSSVIAPPPPPPRQRASSRNSIDAPVLSPGSSRPSGEYFRSSSQPHRVDRFGSSSSQGTNDIIADLDALKREVDALRGQFEKNIIS